MMQLGRYYTYQEIIKEIKRIYEKYQDIISYHSIGTSHDNREIPMLMLGTGTNHLVCSAGVHGRESVNPVVLLKMIEDYCISYTTCGMWNSKIDLKSLLEKYTICFIPLLNPDGYSIALEGFDVICDLVLRKKNKEMNLPAEEWKLNGRGIDINRNFPSVSYVPINENDSAGSENETKALIHVFQTYKVGAYLDFHSRGKIIYYFRMAMGAIYNQQSYAIANELQMSCKYTLGVVQEEFLTTNSGGNTVHYFSENFNLPAITVETVEDEAVFPMDLGYQATTYEEIADLPLVTVQFLSSKIYQQQKVINEK
jgi:Predicted carboxypeptidase